MAGPPKPAESPPPPPSLAWRWFTGLAWALIPAAVTGALVWIGRAHTPEYGASFFGSRFADAQRLKADLGTALLGLAVLQLLLALAMYGVLPSPRSARHRLATAHRVGGLAAFLLSLPIAVHCIRAYGVATFDARVTVHSLAGCFLYGAFAAKVIVVRNRRVPGWAVPIAGGVLVVLIALLWYTAALWDLNGQHVPGF